MFSKKRISITNMPSIVPRSTPAPAAAGEKRSLASTVASTVRRLSVTSSISTVETNMTESLHLTAAQPRPRQESCLRLIERRAWDELRRLLDLAEADSDSSSPGIVPNSTGRAYDDLLPPCVLHAACRHHAPLDILRSIHQLRPSAVREVDADDRAALHHAAAAWNEPAVIKFLLRRNGDAASYQDANGCTPLHLCVHPDDVTAGGRQLSSARSQMQSKEPPLVRIIHYLCCVSPATATLDDDEDCTPIEYAIDSELPLLAVQVLRKASETAHKRSEEEKKRRATMSVLSTSTSGKRQGLLAASSSGSARALLDEGRKADEVTAEMTTMPVPPQVREGQTIRRTSAKSA